VAKNANPPWYTQYPQLRQRANEVKGQLEERCNALGLSSKTVFREFRDEFLVRAVQESNWQEGIYVEPGKTQELAEHVFDDVINIKGPHIDSDIILNHHKANVVSMKRRRVSINHIAAYNLVRAHMLLHIILVEILNRRLAVVMKKVDDLRIDLIAPDGPAMTEVREQFDQLVKRNEWLKVDERPTPAPVTRGFNTLGTLLRNLVELERGDLTQGMDVSYVHLLHKTLMMGIEAPSVCGSFRKVSVHVGKPDLLFPPPSLVPALMEEFCKQFPVSEMLDTKTDLIVTSAEVSHRFVAIHPYRDGNGRVSRLLMNLVLQDKYPIVYLKADKKGRHRYGQALKRADRGNIYPLACLICISII
jgi:fido (protein-threonine AMPylation protein)